jgi:hypothetical protein
MKAQRERRGISLLFLYPQALDGSRWSTPRPGRFAPRKQDTVHIPQEVRWAPGPAWTGAENLSLTGIRSPDRPARSESLYRLRYPGPSVTLRTQIIYKMQSALLHHFPENYILILLNLTFAWIKLSTWSCLEIRTQDEVTVWRLIIVPLKGWNSSNIATNLNKSKFYSGRN